MTRWNIVITIQEHFFEQAWQGLKPFGVLAKTEFHNVLVMQTEDTINFDDPDVIIAVETVAQQAGISIWSREDIKRYPILKLN